MRYEGRGSHLYIFSVGLIHLHSERYVGDKLLANLGITVLVRSNHLDFANINPVAANGTERLPLAFEI